MCAYITLSTENRPSVHVAAQWTCCGYGTVLGSTLDTHTTYPTSFSRLLCSWRVIGPHGLAGCALPARRGVVRGPRDVLAHLFRYRDEGLRALSFIVGSHLPRWQPLGLGPPHPQPDVAPLSCALAHVHQHMARRAAWELCGSRYRLGAYAISEPIPTPPSHAKHHITPAESTLGEHHGLAKRLERIKAGRIPPATSTRPATNLRDTTHGHRSSSTTTEKA